MFLLSQTFYGNESIELALIANELIEDVDLGHLLKKKRKREKERKKELVPLFRYWSKLIKMMNTD